MEARRALVGARFKLARAERYRYELAYELRLWTQRQFHTLRIDHQIDGSKHTLRHLVEVDDPPPPHWGLIVGDWAHNLRSALDYLMYELVRLDRGKPLTMTQFPIFRDIKDYREWRSRDECRMRFLHWRNRLAVNQLQPYRRRDDPVGHPLAFLSAVSNRDKHRLLHMTTSSWHTLELSVVPTDGAELLLVKPHEGRIKQGTDLLRVEFMAHQPNSHVQVEYQPEVVITLDNGLPLVQRMREAQAFVEEVIGGFEPVFGVEAGVEMIGPPDHATPSAKA